MRLVSLCGLLALAGCSAGSPPGTPTAKAAAVIDGRWEFRPATPGRRTALTLDLWQVAGTDSIAGRMVHWMAGDMALDPKKFNPIVGGVSGAQTWFEVSQPPPTAVLRVEAVRQGDSLVITRSLMGGEDAAFEQGSKFVRIGAADTP